MSSKPNSFRIQPETIAGTRMNRTGIIILCNCTADLVAVGNQFMGGAF